MKFYVPELKLKKAAYATIALLVVIIFLINCSPRFVLSNGKTYISLENSIDPRSLITPKDSFVQETLKTILSDKKDIRSDFRRIQDWVASHITYTQDSYYYWQTPAETLMKKTGNCKDFAVLLCTLWRAYGIPASDIYVAVGVDRNNKRHAFVIEKWLHGEWQVIEPQVGGFITSDLYALETAERYSITSKFNDAAYTGEALYISSSGAAATPYSSSTSTGGQSSPSEPSSATEPLPEIKYFYFKTSPNIVGPIGASMLSWSVSDATFISIDQGIGPVNPVGTCIVPSGTGSIYTLTATNSYGTVTSTAMK